MKKNLNKTASALPTIIKGKGGVSLAGPAAPKGTPIAPAAPLAPPAAPALPAAPAAQGTPAKTVNRLVYVDLPKGTERFTNPNSGIEWIRTPKPANGGMPNWYQMAPKGTDETGIHAAVKNADGTWTLTIERDRLPHRKRGGQTHGAIREIDPAKTA
jgi:hypothetical protein